MCFMGNGTTVPKDFAEKFCTGLFTLRWVIWISFELR